MPRGLVGASVALALAVRHLLTSTGPGHRVPGVPGSVRRQTCLVCRSAATRVKGTDLFVCDDPRCRTPLGVAQCAKCSGTARLGPDRQWVCGPGHTTARTRKCPCGRLGERAGDHLWRCRGGDCRSFWITHCECGRLTGPHGYASCYQGDREWHCEFTGATWSER